MRWLRNCSFDSGALPLRPRDLPQLRQNGWQTGGAADAAPAVPAPESTLGSHPCVALSSAQVLPEWPITTPPCNDFSANGDNPLNLVSHSRGSLHSVGGVRGVGVSWVVA